MSNTALLVTLFVLIMIAPNLCSIIRQIVEE